MAEIHKNNPVFRNPRFAADVFEAAKQPVAWLFVSRQLRQSAKPIFEQENPVAQRYWDELQRLSVSGASGEAKPFDETKFPPPANFYAAYMLIAYAIENLLKGLMLAKGIAELSATENYPQKLKGHDLRVLHERAEPKATVTLHLLDALTYMSEWRARYPLPLKLADFWPIDDEGNPKGNGFRFPNSHDEFWAYCNALDAELKSFLSANDQRRIDLWVSI